MGSDTRPGGSGTWPRAQLAGVGCQQVRYEETPEHSASPQCRACNVATRAPFPWPLPLHQAMRRGGRGVPSCSLETSMCPLELPWRQSANACSLPGPARGPGTTCPGEGCLLMSHRPSDERLGRLRSPGRTDAQESAYDSSDPYPHKGEEQKQPGRTTPQQENVEIFL